MNSEKLSLLLGEVKEKYVAEALTYRRRPALKWGALAACLALLAAVGLYFMPFVKTLPAELPMLSIGSEDTGAMGFEGFIAYDISEIISANPWNEDMGLTELPVYKNTVTTDNAGVQYHEFDLDDFTEEVRSRMNLGDAKVTHEAAGTVAIWFEAAVPLPDEYTFGYHASYGDMAKTAEYLLTEYGDLMDFDKPVTDIYYGDRDIYGRQGYHISFYEGKGDNTDRILNYNFDRVTFSPDENGSLWIVRIKTDKYDLSEKVADYPIISADEAEKLLKSGNFITTVPEEYFSDTAEPAKCELVYRTARYEGYFMPYYRFYIELDDEFSRNNELGLKTYGAFYVPAVEGRYIQNMPLWDGRFN